MKIYTLLLFLWSISGAYAQSTQIALVEKLKSDGILPVNREISISEDGISVVMNAKKGDGLGLIKEVSFTEGIIELELKGENRPGRSFVGLAFNIQNDSTYEAIYFRPFNFVSEEEIRQVHMLQYIHHPQYTWRVLRETRTGEFENRIENPPGADEWFRAKIIVKDDRVSVYVNDSETPSLQVERLDSFKSDQIGLWTGFNSAGWFRSIELTDLE